MKEKQQIIEPKTQSEVVFFLLCNAARLDDENFMALMEKLEQWKAEKELQANR